MSMRTRLVVLCLGAVLPVWACGGGEAPKQEPAAAPAGGGAAAPAQPAGGAPAAGGAAGATGNGVIAGKVSFEGTPPAAEKVKLTADPKCHEQHKEGLEKQAVKVKDGGLADVLVYVKSGLSGSYPAATTEVMLDQKGCSYTPHVVAVQANQPLKIRNSDDTLHNIHPRPKANEEFNVGQPRQGMETTKSFANAELSIPVGCDVHPWMRSYIHVLSNPFFAVSKDDGTFEIKGLPAGEYEVEAVHEKLPPQTQKISVKDGEPAKLDLTFKS